MVLCALYTTLWCNYENNERKPEKGIWSEQWIVKQKNVNDMKEKPNGLTRQMSL